MPNRSGLPGRSDSPTARSKAIRLYSCFTLVVVVLAGAQMWGLATIGDQGPTPHLVRALMELPVALLLVFLSTFGVILVGILQPLIGLPATWSPESARAFGYLVAFLFFGAFSASILLPLVLYLRSGRSSWLYLFAAAGSLYVSFVIASY